MTSDSNPPKSTQPCSICGGVRWVSYNVPAGHPDFGKLFPCDCQKTDPAKTRERALHTSRDLVHLADMTFETFNLDRHGLNADQRSSLDAAYQQATEYAPYPRGWLIITGGYGVGKTHLAAAIANSRLRQGLPVTFANVPDLLDYLRAAFNPSVEETFDQRFDHLLDAPLLILDDLGTQNATPWAEEKLFQILNHRYVARLPTVITTNLSFDDLDPRLSSRLADRNLVRVVLISVPDYRRSEFEQSHNSLSSLIHYHDKSFRTFHLRRDEELSADQRQSLQEAVHAASWYAQQPEGWLVLFGNYGCGKTHLAAAIANHLVEQGYLALFVVVPDLLDHLRASFSPVSKVSYDQRFEEVRTIPLLVLDDLGTESATPWAKEKLYQIINYRYAARLLTVITTSSLRAIDDRIRSRILDEAICRLIKIRAPSYRGGQSQLERLEPQESEQDKLGDKSGKQKKGKR